MGDQIRTPHVVIPFFPFSSSFSKAIRLQNCHPYVMSFLLFINFLFLILPWPYLCLFIYIIVLIDNGTPRSNSPQFSRLLIHHVLNYSKIHTAPQFCDHYQSVVRSPRSVFYTDRWDQPFYSTQCKIQ